ncbi:hypothetical protein [Halobaculum gomorrense]|uniref:Uncharacterized protein n=1 Tax=Halobaculum gomorrense TaxID=43928 RepID=A0A1M5KJ74_9EURY|nr:hypothetical protein [Halobaculum gomorrense]SHG52755.1 hypothetical protein SAMN05443636_0531 [Halobaculum gomorrense]
MVAVIDSLIVFVVSALVGGAGIFAGAAVLSDARSYGHAVWTALIGALAWVVVSTLFGWLPILGTALTYLAYLAVIKWRYAGGWLTAAGIALVGWLASTVVLSVLAAAGLGGFSALGVPGA